MNNDNSAKKTFAPDLACANILVTGGSGFIGSNFIRHVLAKPDFRGIIVNVDKLTYAGNPANLSDIEANFGGKRYFFVQSDICDFSRIRNVFETHRVDRVVHFAAESHVDRSIFGPKEFVETNIVGTFSLLEAARASWAGVSGARFHHISTDEVYGSLGETGFFFETTPYDPRSPYSATKASSDHLVRAYAHTYGLPVSISNCSNNYGPYHFPEKLIPLAILNALEGKDIPVYGDGRNVRDWLFVEDHCDAVWTILAKGRPGETYNIGGECEQQNIQVVTAICDILEDLAPSRGNRAIKNRLPAVRGYRDLITFVSDRPGHDRRYAINCDKIKNELGWRQKHDFKGGLRTTVAWYLNNSGWVSAIRSGEYRTWLEKNYKRRPS